MDQSSIGKEELARIFKAGKKHETRKRIRRGKLLYAMLAVPVIWYVIFSYIPMFGLGIAFENFNLYKGVFRSQWVGFAHFVRLFGDPYFWNVVRSNVILGLLTFVLCFPLPIILALLLNEMKDSIFKRVAQSISYLPYFVSTVALVNILTIMLSPSMGIVNKIIESLGVQPINFLVESVWFRPIYVLLLAWVGTGFTSIIYLSAMSSIDPELYEAAAIDGAGKIGRMWNITLPGIAGTVTTILLINLPGIISLNFEVVLLLQKSVTFDVSDVISTYVYRRGLLDSQFSYAAAVSLVFSIVSVAIVYFANRLSRRISEVSLW